MKKKMRIKFADQIKSKSNPIRLFASPEEAYARAVEEAEAAGVSPGAVMVMSESASVTGSGEGPAAVESVDPEGLGGAYEPSEAVSGDSVEEEAPEASIEEVAATEEAPEAVALSDMTRDELLEEAKAAGIDAPYKLNKGELVEALEASE